MSGSFQAFPPPAMGMIYPTTMTTTPTTTSHEDNSSGSFGMVFVVLAIILVVSAVACVLGRFCTKKSNKSSGHKPKAHNKQQSHGPGSSHHHKPSHSHSHSHNQHGSKPGKGVGRPRDPDLEFGYRSKEGDITLGFDKKVKYPTAKVANNGDFKSNSFGRQAMEHGGMGMPRDFP